MKKFLIAAVAASLVGTPAVAQPLRGDTVRTKVVQNHRGQVIKTVTVRRDDRRGFQQQRRWAKGQRFDRNRATNYRVIQSPRAYRLQNAPRGYHRVQSGNDAVMIGITSGIVAAVMANIIR
jgi:Ni/Co efflux regulator RcnB